MSVDEIIDIFNGLRATLDELILGRTQRIALNGKIHREYSSQSSVGLLHLFT